MIESKLIYNNLEIDKVIPTPQDYDNILKDFAKHMDTIVNMESPTAIICKSAYNFLKENPMDCIKDLSITNDSVAISYDCVRGNKKIGAFCLLVTFSYERVEDQIDYIALFDYYGYNYRMQEAVKFNDFKSYKAKMKEIKEICLTNTLNNVLIERYVNSEYKNDVLNNRMIKLTQDFDKLLNNAYTQYYDNKDYIRVQITPPKSSVNGDNKGCYLDIGMREDKYYLDYYCGLNNTMSKVFDPDETSLEEVLNHIRASKSLLHKFGLNSFSSKYFSKKTK